MVKLTTLRQIILKAIPDWSAPYEIRARIGWGQYPDTIIEVPLRNLVKRGLAQLGPSQNTYRITPAGRAAIGGEKT